MIKKADPKTSRSKTPTQKRKELEGQVRELSPRINQNLSNNNDFSPSPLRVVGRSPNNDLYLQKEISNYKMKERKLQQQLNMLIQEHTSLKKVFFNTENNIKLKTAKIENERETILQTLIDCVNKKQITLDLPNNYDPSTKSEYSQGLYKSSKNSVSATNTPANYMNGQQVIDLNIDIKNQLSKVGENIPSTLRAIVRAEYTKY